MSVGIAHVGLHSSDKAVAYHPDDAEQKAEPHASGGEDESGEEHAHGGGQSSQDRALALESRHHSLKYIKPAAVFRRLRWR